MNGLAQVQTISMPLRGSEQKDSTVVEVPISIIKKANERLIQRKYLISIYYEQDSIIQYKNDYILNQQEIIDEMQEQIIGYNKLNQHLETSLDKQKKKNKILTYGAAGVVVGLLIGVIAK